MTTILEQWHYKSDKAEISIVLPDGCRDFIWKTDQNGSQSFMTELDDSAYFIEHNMGSEYIGYRFQPGTVVQVSLLNSALKNLTTNDQNIISNYLNECSSLNSNITEALHSLKEHQPISVSAKRLGVSQRTLERLVYKYTQRSPIYWRNLARIRKAAARLIQISVKFDQTLMDLAIEFNFSDQAHMNREFKQWFGVSPKQFKNNKQLYHSAFVNGYN